MHFLLRFVSDEKREVRMCDPNLDCCLSKNIEILRGNSATDLPQAPQQESLEETEENVDVIPLKKIVWTSVSLLNCAQEHQTFSEKHLQFQSCTHGCFWWLFCQK